MVEIFDINSRVRGVKIITIVDEEVPQVIRTDLKRVRQVLFNLLSNAMKFTYVGSVTIKVSPGRGGNLSISVEDTGIGMTEDKII